MNIPIHKRKFHSFISHAYIDQNIVEELESWLVNKAGFSIWYDAHFYQAESELGNILEQCKSIIILLSEKAIESGWVKKEFDNAQDQQVKNKDSFLIISIKVEVCSVPSFLEKTYLVDLSKNGFDFKAAGELILSLYPAIPFLEAQLGREFYPDHLWDEFGRYGEKKSKKILRLVRSNLKNRLKLNSKSKYIFYGTGLKSEHKSRNQLVRRLIQRVALKPCLMGEDIRHGHVQHEIIERIVNANVMIADVSEENLNTRIEAGVALGAGVPIHLLSSGARRKPPFMFRDQQIWHYDNDVDLIGVIHNLVLPYRERI